MPQDWIKAEARRTDAERRRCYVQRGRQHQTESDERLDALWIAGMRAWAAASDTRPLALDDAEAEMALRDREPPQDRVASEIAALIDAMGRSLQAKPADIVRGAIAQAMSAAPLSLR